MSSTHQQLHGLAERASVTSQTDGAPVVIKEISLKLLLAKATPDNLHPETDWGRPMGKEIRRAKGGFRTPKGWHKKAQGNALGKRIKNN
jgi:hypothetical protein